MGTYSTGRFVLLSLYVIFFFQSPIIVDDGGNQG